MVALSRDQMVRNIYTYLKYVLKSNKYNILNILSKPGQTHCSVTVVNVMITITPTKD